MNLDRCQQQHQTLKDKLAAIIHRFCSFYYANPTLFHYLLLDHHGNIRKMTPDTAPAR